MSALGWAAATRQALDQALAADPSVVVVCEEPLDLGDRQIVVPVSDRAAVAFAVGLALGGRRPVVQLTSSGRLPAVLEALAEAASMARGRDLRVPLVVRVPTGTEAGDRVDRPATELLAAIDGLRVVCASSSGAAASLLRAAIAADGPVVLLEPRVLAGRRSEPEDVTLDRARVLRSGAHVTLAAWGAGVQAALDAADALSRDGIDAGVLDLVSLAPLDRATLGAEVRRTGRVVAVHPGEPGFAERVLRVGLDEAFLHLESPPIAALAAADAIATAARGAVHY